jgi:type I restriction enzyme M protein
MKPSLGNKRHKIGDPDEGDPDQIGEITRLHGSCTDGETRDLPDNGGTEEPVVSRVFDNADFGFHKITVERPLRLSFQATPERIARLEEQSAFANLVKPKKKREADRQREIEVGRARQQQIRELLRALAEETGGRLFSDRTEFLKTLKKLDRGSGVRLQAAELKAVLAALGERDETAAICRDRKGQPEPDPELRDTEIVPLKESIEAYFEREVKPHVADAWIDHSKTKIGYEIPLNRHFYRYTPPRPLDEIEADIKRLETEILELLKEVTA